MNEHEINNAVATKLGWQLVQSRAGLYKVEDANGESVILHSAERYWCYKKTAWKRSLKNWANNLNDAYSLLDNAPDFRLLPVYGDGEKHFTECRIYEHPGADVYHAASDESPAVAICKAWLMSRGAADG